MKESGFGSRLAALRKAKALTQEELGEQVGLSKRMISHYEREDAKPPAGAILADLARALGCSTDQLLGLGRGPDQSSRKRVRLFKRLREVEKLPPGDQRVLLKLLDALLERRGVA